MSKYRWIITADYFSDNDSDCAVGKMGPRDADNSITKHAVVFDLYDDDGEHMAKGMLFGDYDGFEPLDDFGKGNWGCTSIKINGEEL